MGLILLPCEVFHREFDAKLILAARLASDYGHHVLIGYDKFFNLLNSYLPSSVMLDKSCSSILYNGRIKSIKENNGCVIINDEEGFNNLAINPASHQAALARVHLPASEAIDSYVAWGRVDADFFSQIPNLSHKISLLGNCRSDLLNDIGRDYYKDTIVGLKSCFNEFFLVSDNFCVERWDDNYKIPSLANDASVNKNLEEAFTNRQRIASIKRQFFSDALLAAVKHFPGINFILRPHPMANPLWWNKQFNKFRNVHVIYSDSVEPWIHSCQGLISMGCTTSLQSLLAGKYISELKNNSIELSDGISFASRFIKHAAYSPDELITDLDLILSGEKKDDQELITELRDVWVNTQTSSTHIFSSHIDNFAIPLSSNDLQKLFQVLNSFIHSPYSKTPLNSEKWPYPSLKQLQKRISRLASSVFTNSFKFNQVVPGLYLLSPVD